jgi:hypothetical protein
MTFSLTISEQDGPTVLAEIELSGQAISVVSDIRLDEGTITLYNLHIDGPGAGVFGVSALRRLIDRIMVFYDVECLEIHGFRRTTGANPGRIPTPLRFSRHRSDS